MSYLFVFNSRVWSLGMMGSSYVARRRAGLVLIGHQRVYCNGGPSRPARPTHESAPCGGDPSAQTRRDHHPGSAFQATTSHRSSASRHAAGLLLRSSPLPHRDSASRTSSLGDHRLLVLSRHHSRREPRRSGPRPRFWNESSSGTSSDFAHGVWSSSSREGAPVQVHVVRPSLRQQRDMLLAVDFRVRQTSP